jgi:His/Glu/Gln/Arg/opine family amino acid ABC transporter permease subunit
MSFDLGLILQYLPRLLSGAGLTVELIAVSSLAGLLIAVPVALMRVSDSVSLRSLSLAYVFFFRGTPLLIQIFLVYYGLSQFEAVRDSALWPFLRQPYWCAIIAFALNTGAYTAEILRGAMQAVPKGEIEAARAFGMSTPLSFRRVVLPRAVRIGWPAYGNEVIFMIKGSALASTITLLDLTGMARTIIAKTYAPVEIFLAAGLIYLVIVFVLTRVFRVIERRLNLYLAHESA